MSYPPLAHCYVICSRAGHTTTTTGGFARTTQHLLTTTPFVNSKIAGVPSKDVETGPLSGMSMKRQCSWWPLLTAGALLRRQQNTPR